MARALQYRVNEGRTRTPEESMTRSHSIHRTLAVALLAALAVSLASPAFADRDRRRYKGDRHDRVIVVRERSSVAGPVLAGLIGGYLLANATSVNATVVHETRPARRPVTVVRYHDPYCDEWYETLDDCDFRGHRHPRVVHVVDVRHGRELRRLEWRRGDWHEWHDRYDDEDDCDR